MSGVVSGILVVMTVQGVPMRYTDSAALPELAVGSDGRLALILAGGVFSAAESGTASSGAGPRVVKNFAMFRTGTLKDSAGVSNKWTLKDLKDMVSNFNTLKASNVLPNVPVRENHGRDVREVCGYITALRVKGNVLFGDLELTEPDAIGRYDRGTYRSRSIELGAYEANDGAVYFPTVMGLAFCDIPAVEGLFASSIAAYSDEDREVRTFAAAPAAEDPAEESSEFAPVLAALHALATKYVDNPEFHSAVQAVIGAVEQIQASDAPDGSGEATCSCPSCTTASSSAKVPPARKSSSNSGAEMPEIIKFTVGGRELDLVGDAQTAQVLATFASDLLERDATISTLRESARVSAEDGRVAAVDAWVFSKKITPAQVDGLKAFVRTLSDEQFTAHAALVASGPDLSFTANHAEGATQDEQNADREATIRTHRQTYSMSKAAGLTPEKLAQSKSALALVALGVPLEG